jgi:hypothetical protein
MLCHFGAAHLTDRDLLVNDRRSTEKRFSVIVRARRISETIGVRCRWIEKNLLTETGSNA